MAAQAVDFTVSGHVSRAVVITDVKDKDTTTTVEDHGSSGTRVRFVGSSETEAGVTAGINLEFGEKANLRKSFVSFGGGFGSLNLGHAAEAADGTTYAYPWGGLGIGHSQETGGSTAADFTPGGMGGTREGIHFSSGAFGPASISFSAANGDRYSGALVVAGDTGLASYEAKLGYLQWEDGDNDLDEISGSLAVTLANGVNGSFSAATWGNDGTGSFFQTTLGYKFGNNSVAVSWYSSDEISVTRDVALVGNGNAVGIGFVHTLPKSQVEILASVQQFSAEIDTTGSEETDTVAIFGSRIKF